jgi:hypothetical protein
MKLFRKRFFRVFFIVSLLSCIEADAFSYSGIQNYYIELPGENSESGNMLLSDNDSLNHDQIPQSLKHQIVQKPICRIPVLQVPFLISDFSVSIWQPPKI